MPRYLPSACRFGNRHSIIFYTILPGSTGRGAAASATDPHQLAQQFPRLRPVTDAMRADAHRHTRHSNRKGAENGNA
jgi:hypothetical protein